MASADYLRIGKMSGKELEQIMVRGGTPALDDLAGHEFRGMNIAFWAAHSPIQKFIKGMYRDRSSGQVYGYNQPVVQNGPEGPWIAKPSDDAPKRFGFYSVAPVDPGAKDNTYLHAVLLDYGKGGNFRLDPTSRLRDYLVTVPDTDLILGKAYLAFGPARVATNYFVLERHRETAWVR